jgi:hypothetical protein
MTTLSRFIDALFEISKQNMGRNYSPYFSLFPASVAKEPFVKSLILVARRPAIVVSLRARDGRYHGADTGHYEGSHCPGGP